MNDDYFLLDVPASNVFRVPKVAVFDADIPLNVTLYDHARNVVQSWAGVRTMRVDLPGNSTFYLKVSGNAPTRYRISTGLFVDPRAVPGPLQKELEIIPEWWKDPQPLNIDELVKDYAIEVDRERGDGNEIAFELPSAELAAAALTVQLFDLAGSAVGSAEAVDGRLAIGTGNLERGHYIVRVTRRGGAEDASTALSLSRSPPLQ
jgi:hypothetical protein